MKYALLIYSDEAPDAYSKLSEAEQNAIMREYFAISELPATLNGAQLQPSATATTVRVDSGSTLTTDGPFAETKDAALEIAARVPAARMGGSVEVRPLVER